MFNYTLNLLKLARSDRHLHPRVAIYYLTGQCNLNCAYCEDFGARRNEQNQRPLPLEQVLQILHILRSGVDTLMLTGGEPFTHPDIDQIVIRAKQELKFRELTLISNGFLLPQHEAALSAVDRLIVSLDSLDPQLWSQTIGAPLASAETILANIVHYAELQNKFGYRMIVNAVITPETINGFDNGRSGVHNGRTGDNGTYHPVAQRSGRNILSRSAAERTLEDLLSFCTQHHLLISFSPQSYNNWPRYELTVSSAYRDFVQKLIQLKRAGAPVLGSDLYLRTLSAFEPYDCYPTLVPRIYPNGDLSYPCRPLEKAENGQGGRVANLLKVKNWAEAWKIVHETYGQPPRTCHSCFQQCYAEPSLMQSRPLALALESLRAGVDLSTYSPG